MNFCFYSKYNGKSTIEQLRRVTFLFPPRHFILSIWSLNNFTHTSTVPHAGILYFTAISLSDPSPARYASTTFLLNFLVYDSFAGFSSNTEQQYALKILIHLWTVVIHTLISWVRLVTDSLPSKYLLHISIFSSHKKTSSANSAFNYLHCLLGVKPQTLPIIITNKTAD